MTEDYFNQLDAPVKSLLFQNSTHSPMFEEPEKFLDIIQEDVLTGKTELADFK